MAFLENVSANFDVTTAELTAKPQIMIFLDRGASVEGHNGLISLSDTLVELRLKKRVLKIIGENLIVKELTKTDAYIAGKILEVHTGK